MEAFVLDLLQMNLVQEAQRQRISIEPCECRVRMTVDTDD